MLTISKPLSAGQAAAYHASEFTSAEQSYYTQSGQVRGEWQGKLAAEWNLAGEVSAEAFSRLAAGQHPETAEQLVRYQEPREYTNDAGEVVRTMEHRAGWDATFSAPKSVSLTALVGGDERVREAHREAVRTALNEIEHYVQARIGGNAPAETTGKWVAASFEHEGNHWQQPNLRFWNHLRVQLHSRRADIWPKDTCRTNPAPGHRPQPELFMELGGQAGWAF